MTAWCLLLLGLDLLAWDLGAHGTRNLWIAYVLTPVSGALALWALSTWQTAELTRITMRLAIPLLLAASLALQLAVEHPTDFSRATQPMASLLCLIAAAYTLLALSLRANRGLTNQDWFWVSAGMALYFGVTGMIGPLSALLVAESPRLLLAAFEARAGLEVVAFLLISVGMTCPSET